MKNHVRLLCVVLLGATLAPAMAAAAETPATRILLTADTEGEVGPCRNCPAGVGLGGLVRCASAVASLRAGAAGGPVLLLDAGNFLVGADTLAGEGKGMVAAYDALGYDAANLSYRDLRMGKGPLLAALAGAKFSPVSANLIDDTTGKPLTRPYVVKIVGGRRTALIGITEPPAGYDVLPHLREELSGVTIRPPADALAEWLPKARAESDEVVLLYYGTATGARAMAGRFGADLRAIGVGGIRPARLRAG